jgi:hypothetical protein
MKNNSCRERKRKTQIVNKRANTKMRVTNIFKIVVGKEKERLK